MSDVRDRVRAAMRKLVAPDSRVLLACSGGSDSQAMLHLLAAHPVHPPPARLWAVGVDHGLRADAKDELEHARELANQLGVPFQTLQVSVKKGENTLASARRARLRALGKLADELGADRIALGHTATDRAETVLLFLARGASLKGASSMRQRRGRIIRPLLEVERHELRAYNQGHQISWADDPSNVDPDRARTRLREKILPELVSLNAGAVRHLGRFATWAEQDDRLLQRAARRVLRDARGPMGSLDAACLASAPEPIARRVIHVWLRKQGLSSGSRQIRTIIEGLRDEHLRTSIMRRSVRLEAGRLWAYSVAQNWQAPLLQPGTVRGRVEIPGLDCALETKVTDPPAPSFDDQQTVAFDADRLHLPLTARAWKPGDRLKPFGHPGHVTVGNLFTNEKFPGALRAHWPLVLCGDEVVWVAGLRRGSVAPVTTESRRIIVISLQGAPSIGA